MSMEGKPLVDLDPYPVIYADGVGTIDTIGHNMLIRMYRWRKLDGVFQPCIAAEILRPRIVSDVEILAWRKAMAPCSLSELMAQRV